MTARNWLNDTKRTITLVFGRLVFIVCLTVSVSSNMNIPDVPDSEVIIRTIPEADRLFSSLSFVNDSICFIQDPSQSMVGFVDELFDLLHGKDSVINIVHLGDSHIQAGYLSGRTMRLLHNSFGNAGRGWIAPFKLSKLNEPPDYYILSNVKEWISGRCIQATPKCPWGIGGIGIQTKTKDVDFRVIMTPTNGAGYSFNKVLLYRDSNATPLSPVKAETGQLFLSPKENQTPEKILIDTFITTSLVDTLALQSIKTPAPSNPSNLYYGFMLLNGNPGILYHAIGVNGAKFVDFTKRDYIRQLSLLRPSLLIISLGTNEAHGRNFSKETFESQVNALVRLIREEIPATAILLTTPAETYKSVTVNKKRQYVRNENIAKATEVILSYTQREGLASWDLYAITGGDNSCTNWFDAKLYGRDRIHFSRAGYEEQGLLLYKAIARSCVLPLPQVEISLEETATQGFPFEALSADRQGGRGMYD